MGAPNTTCTGRRGFSDVFEPFSDFEVSLIPNIVHDRPAAANANRWAVMQRY